ncbi:hypothetical protein BJ138DRAFT_1139607 [Hygrophoropsis aurantiaca]|uniref:Uncharacterized protein n=1 Tax=Hygrophoropsis aurantiaca TaxID=72124 RepID=A0ACB8ATT5_9AGAM|nr:hypothetical protein BJ138DRAFT_1139607 [Hygrophoropsis aurantiaca]
MTSGSDEVLSGYDVLALQRVSYIAIAALVVVVCDHVYMFTKEARNQVQREPIALTSLLYTVNRYMGTATLIAGAIGVDFDDLIFCHVLNPLLFQLLVSYQLVEFESWGTLVNVWVVQVTMQLRIYAMYHRSKRIGTSLGICFMAQIIAAGMILYLSHSSTSVTVSRDMCIVTGIRGTNIVKTYIPMICYEVILFAIVARVSAKNIIGIIRSRNFGRANSVMKALARDSLIYFFSYVSFALTICELTLISITASVIYAVVVMIGSRLVLSIREYRKYVDLQVGTVEPGLGSRMRFATPVPANTIDSHDRDEVIGNEIN